MTDIKENYKKILDQMHRALDRAGRPRDAAILIAVSKRKTAREMMDCIDAGGSHFGENYIQEAMEKIDEIGRDRACWHFIGHLQSNKAKFAVPYFDYIHTVDSVKLAKEINKQAKKIAKVQKVFMQVNIGEESTKSGTALDGAVALAGDILAFENISVEGLMCMPPYFSDAEQARPYFQQLVAIRDDILAKYGDKLSLPQLSMGMSNDFKVALEEGATMVRVGTSIFGSRL